MSPNVPEFKWTVRSETAAKLVADDKLSDEQIGKEVGLNRRTITRWRNHPEFKARVEKLIEEIHEAIKRKGIAHKQNRIDGYVDRHNRMRRVLDARAELYRDVPGGGETGLLVRRVNLIKVYESSESRPPENDADENLYPAKTWITVEEFAIDAALLREMRDLEKQIAVELGEWTEKREHTGADGAALIPGSLVSALDKAYGESSEETD
jgi:ParB-like chromosome segregation protein Spo0J